MYQYLLSHSHKLASLCYKRYSQYGSILLFTFVLTIVGCGKTTNIEPEPPKPIYTTDMLIYLESDGYNYIARITADTFPGATEVPVQIFAPHLQRKFGDTLPIKKVESIRQEPDTGWTTRLIGAEYFDGTQWKFEWNIKEMEGYYLLPETFQGVRRIDFPNIRFPIPQQKSSPK